MLATSSRVWFGALLIVAAEACFAGIGALVKQLSLQLNQQQIVFYRNAFALLPLLLWFGRYKLAMVRTTVWHWHALRATTGIISMYCFFYVISQIPLAQAMLVLMAAPFAIPVVARLWLQERISLMTWLAIVLGFAGVVLASPIVDGQWSWALLIGAFGALLVAVTKTTLRKLAATEPAYRTVFYFSLLTTLASLPAMLWHYQPVTSSQFQLFAVMGALAIAGQLMMTKGFAYANAAQLGLFTYSSIIFAAILGFVFWQEPVTLAMALGIALIIYAGFISLRQRWL